NGLVELLLRDRLSAFQLRGEHDLRAALEVESQFRRPGRGAFLAPQDPCCVDGREANDHDQQPGQRTPSLLDRGRSCHLVTQLSSHRSHRAGADSLGSHSLGSHRRAPAGSQQVSGYSLSFFALLRAGFFGASTTRSPNSGSVASSATGSTTAASSVCSTSSVPSASSTATSSSTALRMVWRWMRRTVPGVVSMVAMLFSSSIETIVPYSP